jgi:hypothetical protein
MKKVIISAIVALMFCLPNTSEAQCFEKGDVLLNPGISFGNRMYGNRFFRPNFSFSADIGVHDYVSVGPYVAAAFAGDRRNAFSIGARGNFHWWQLIADNVEKDIKQDQFEMYLTVWLGGTITRFNDGPGPGNNGRSEGGFDGGATLGARWYPNANDRVAIFGEWGRGPISWGTVGATIKVN